MLGNMITKARGDKLANGQERAAGSTPGSEEYKAQGNEQKRARYKDPAVKADVRAQSKAYARSKAAERREVLLKEMEEVDPVAYKKLLTEPQVDQLVDELVNKPCIPHPITGVLISILEAMQYGARARALRVPHNARSRGWN